MNGETRFTPIMLSGVIRVTPEMIVELERSAVEDGLVVVHESDGSSCRVIKLTYVECCIGQLTRREQLTAILQTHVVYGPASEEECRKWIEGERGIYLGR